MGLFNVKCQFYAVDEEKEKGGLKKRTPQILIEAEHDFCILQAKAYEFWKGEYQGDLVVQSIVSKPYLKVLGDNEAEGVFVFKMSFTISDDNGKEKEVNEEYIIQARDIEEAEQIGRQELIDGAAWPSRLKKLEHLDKVEAVFLDGEEEPDVGKEDEDDGFYWDPPEV